MFNVVTIPTFSRNVPVPVPSGDDFKEESLKATFCVRPDDEVSFDANSPEDIKRFLREIIVCLDDLADDKGKPVAYSPEIRDQLLQLPYVRIALLRAYTGAQVKAVTGN